MPDAARKAQSERMKAYWAKRKKTVTGEEVLKWITSRR
jgi:hypothetical protein